MHSSAQQVNHSTSRPKRKACKSVLSSQGHTKKPSALKSNSSQIKKEFTGTPKQDQVQVRRRRRRYAYTSALIQTAVHDVMAELSKAVSNTTTPSKRRKTLDDDAIREKLDLAYETQLIYVDGACYRNGKTGARAGFGIYFGPADPCNISARLPGYQQTNQRAELFAALKALESIYLDYCLNRSSFQRSICILSDSKYVVEGLTKWVRMWDERGWRTVYGTPVISQDLYKRAHHMLQTLSANKFVVQLKHTPGHRGILGNEAADRLARKGVWKEESMDLQCSQGYDDYELDTLIDDMLAYEDEQLDQMIAEIECI
jgi:ribonuclease HI